MDKLCSLLKHLILKIINTVCHILNYLEIIGERKKTPEFFEPLTSLSEKVKSSETEKQLNRQYGSLKIRLII